MKRITCFLLLTLALAAAPVRASTGPETLSGTITLGVASPTPARMTYNNSSGNNGLVGYAWTLPPAADGKTYTLKRVSGATGMEDLDAYFYTSLTSDQGSCDASADIKQSGDTETGTICPNPAQVARYVVIVMKVGANTAFSFIVN